MDGNRPQRSPKELWQDYLFLTREMSKFLSKKDFDMFFELLSQREKLQEALDQVPNDTFKLSPEGKLVIGNIRQDNLSIMMLLKLNLNQLQQRHNTAQSYEGGAPAAGRRFDYQG